MKLLVGPLRKRDFAAAQKVDYFIANSNHIKNDISEFYKKESVVINPPVDISRFKKVSEERKGFVTAGRQVPYKKTEIIIEACNNLNVPLKVIGSGPEHAKLKKLAGPSVDVIEKVSDLELAKYLANSEAFIFAAFEDFGITPVEAMASGTPVIAYKAGGALDYVIEEKTGLFFNEQTSKSLMKTVSSFDPKKFIAEDIRKHANQFSNESFQESIKRFLTTL